MNTRQTIARGRWGFAGALVAVLVLSREPLMQWFSIGSPSPATESRVHLDAPSADSSDHAHAKAPPVVIHSFGVEDLTALREVFLATEEIRVAVSQDRIDLVPGSVVRVREGLGRVNDPAIPEPVMAAIAKASVGASALAKSDSAIAARAPYAELSEGLFRLALADPRLQEGWRVFSCPMAEGFPKWFQASEEVGNPYMGQRMLACGSASDWHVGTDLLTPPVLTGEVAYHTCSMHPSVRQQAAGTCPICSMDLTPVTHEELESGEVLVDSVRRQRIGVRTEGVERRPLVRTIEVVGEVVWDESRVLDVTARVDGWVEDLRVTREGDPVKQNATLLRFYGPELLATQRELLVAPPGGRLAKAARERLRLWGMSNTAITEMLHRGQPRARVSLKSPIEGVVIEKRVNEGAHVSAGALLYRVADPSRVWVLGEVFEQDLPHVAVGQQVRVSLPRALGQPVVGEVAYIYPTVSRDTRAAKVRIELDNASGAWRPGMFANLSFDVDLGEHLAVPVDAIIYTGPRRLVFVDEGEGRLRPVEVRVGARAGDWVIVTGGLDAGDVVVSSGVFLLAAESRIRSATGYWESTDVAQ